MARGLKVEVVDGLVDYREALEQQYREVNRILADPSRPYALRWLEHRSVLTTGRSYEEEHLLMNQKDLEEKGVDVVEVSRGGSITYHGPGQLVGYLHLHLKEMDLGLTTFLRDMEQWVMDALGSIGIAPHREKGKTGVWTEKGKICAMGIAAKKFVTYHGIGLNRCVDRRAFSWIVPCGLSEPVASMDQFEEGKMSREELIERMMEHQPPWLKSLPRVL